MASIINESDAIITTALANRVHDISRELTHDRSHPGSKLGVEVRGDTLGNLNLSPRGSTNRARDSHTRPH